jgi:hypothetical protein
MLAAAAGALMALTAAKPGDAAAEPALPQAVQARRLARQVTLDGKLDEADWQSAPVLDRLWENFPLNQVRAPEQTEVRFLYDDRYLYVGFRLRLGDPATLRKPFVRRDKVGSTHDYVQVYLDPQGTGQTSTLFRVNARGTQTDGVQDEAKQSESTDPDFEWEERSFIDSEGWSAELRIPLSTLRVSKSGPQTWNVIVTRGVPRDQNTQMATAPWPRNGSCFQCLASKLVFPDLSASAERLIVEPSAVATLRRDRGSFGHGTSLDAEPSVDAKWLPFGGAAVDLTINPDFSQVEADSPQLTANERFAINLPEKRPFFREGSDLINTPLPILYTRTIAAPDYGLRFTQRSASLNGTIFGARDSGRGLIVEPGLLSSSAASPDFDSKVAFGHVTERRGSALFGALVAAKLNTDCSYNELGGFDGAWQSSTDRLVGQLLYSRTRNPERPDLLPSWKGQRLSGFAGFAQWDHTGSFVSTLRYTRYAPGFRSWLGFVPRVDYSGYYGSFRRDFFPASLAPVIDRIGPYISYERLDAIDLDGTESDPTLGVQIDATKAIFADISWHPRKQVLTEQGEERRFGQVQWQFQSSPSGRIPVIFFNGTIGRDVDFANGDVVPITDLAGTLRLQPFDRLQLEGRYSVLTLGGAPGGGFRLRETIPELLATYFFGPAFYVFADLQLHRARRRFPTFTDDRSKLASVQFVWEPELNWRSYFGVRTGREHPADPSGRGTSTELYVKIVRRFALGGL